MPGLGFNDQISVSLEEKSQWNHIPKAIQSVDSTQTESRGFSTQCPIHSMVYIAIVIVTKRTKQQLKKKNKALFKLKNSLSVYYSKWGKHKGLLVSFVKLTPIKGSLLALLYNSDLSNIVWNWV